MIEKAVNAQKIFFKEDEVVFPVFLRKMKEITRKTKP
jgi:hypothetical protein